jgi:hypothetical protein
MKVHDCANNWGAVPLLSICLGIEEKFGAFDLVKINLIGYLDGLLLEIYVEIIIDAIDVDLSYSLLAYENHRTDENEPSDSFFLLSLLRGL